MDIRSYYLQLGRRLSRLMAGGVSVPMIVFLRTLLLRSSLGLGSLRMEKASRGRASVADWQSISVLHSRRRLDDDDDRQRGAF